MDPEVHQQLEACRQEEAAIEAKLAAEILLVKQAAVLQLRKVQARKDQLWKTLCQSTDCVARDSSHSTAQQLPEGAQRLSNASPDGPELLAEAAASAGVVADAQPAASLARQHGAIQPAGGDPDDKDRQDASGEDLRSGSAASQASSEAGVSAATSTGSASSADPPDPRCPTDFANTCTYLKPRGPFARAGGVLRVWPAHLWAGCNETPPSTGQQPARGEGRMTWDPARQRDLETSSTVVATNEALADHADGITVAQWRWALQPEVRRIRQRAMRQVLWSEQRRRRALQEPEADAEAPALGSAAAFCMRAAVSDGEHEPAEDSGDEESVLDLWGDDPGDFTDSEAEPREPGRRTAGAAAPLEEDLTPEDGADAGEILRAAGDTLRAALRHLASVAGLQGDELDVVVDDLFKTAVSAGLSQADALTQKRLADALEIIAEHVDAKRKAWKVPIRLRLADASNWEDGRRPGTLERWRGDVQHHTERLLRLALEVAKVHVVDSQGARVSAWALQAACSVVTTQLELILENQHMLEVSGREERPTPPKAVARKSIVPARGQPQVLAGSASGSSLYESESDDGIIYDIEEVPQGGGRASRKRAASPRTSSQTESDSGAASPGSDVQPGMTEVQVAGKRRRMLPEEVQADDEAIVIDEAEPADQAGPSHAEHSSSVSEPRRLQPERVHPGKLQAPDVAARVLHVEAKAPGKPPLAVTAPGHSLERSVGSDADSESSDASMSETDQPLQGEEELCSDDEVDSQDPDSESLQGTTVSQGSASASSTLSSSPDDAPAASELRRAAARAAAATRAKKKRKERDDNATAHLARREQREERKRQRLEESQKESQEDPALLQEAVDLDQGLQGTQLFPELPSAQQVVVPAYLASKLKPHQMAGIRFLWRCLYAEHETVAPEDMDDLAGCILAHSMGLGKTLQTISFLILFHARKPGTRSLVVTPANVLSNWQAEFEKWLPKGKEMQSHMELTRRKVFVWDSTNFDAINQWHKLSGSVLILSYSKFKNLHRSKAKAGIDMSEQKEAWEKVISGADVVVADEAHEIKNSTSQVTQAMRKVHTKRRLALTGYPLQNKLDEYYEMITWCCDNILDTPQYFKSTFADPIAKGQQAEASREETREMNSRLSVLHGITKDFIQRQGPDLLAKLLPPKVEHVILLHMAPVQSRAYQEYIKVVHQDSTVKDNFWRDCAALFLIANLPREYQAYLEDLAAGNVRAAEEKAEQDSDKSGAGKQAADAELNTGLGGMMTPELRPLNAGDTPNGPGAAAASFDILGAPHLAAQAHLTPLPRASSKKSSKCPLPPGAAQLLLSGLKTAEAELQQRMDTLDTAKQDIMLQIVRLCQESKEKLIIFSERHYALKATENAFQEHLGWQKDREYLRLDGKTVAGKRQALVDSFQDPDSPVQVILLSTKAGALGINLVAAHRMIIFDEPWNPVWNAQAIGRIYRMGQQHPTFVYRLLYSGTAEHVMHNQSVDKQGLFMRVVDEKYIRGRDSKNRKVYYFDPPAQGQMAPAEDSTDPVLKEVLRQDRKRPRPWIANVKDYKDSLPEDLDQILSKEQRRAARAAYRRQEREEQARMAATEGGNKGRSRRLRRLRKAASDDDDEDFVPPPGLEKDLQGTPRHIGHQQQVPAAPGSGRVQPAAKMGFHRHQRPFSGAQPSAGPAQQAAQSTSGAAHQLTPQQSAPQLPGKPSPAAAQQAGQPPPQQRATPGSGPRPGQPLSFYDQVMAGAPDAANTITTGQQASLQSGRTPGHAPAITTGQQASLQSGRTPGHKPAIITGQQASLQSGRTPGRAPASEEQARLEQAQLLLRQVVMDASLPGAAAGLGCSEPLVGGGPQGSHPGALAAMGRSMPPEMAAQPRPGQPAAPTASVVPGSDPRHRDPRLQGAGSATLTPAQLNFLTKQEGFTLEVFDRMAPVAQQHWIQMADGAVIKAQRAHGFGGIQPRPGMPSAMQPGSAPQVGMMGQKQDATEGNLPAPLSPKWVGRRSRSPASRIGRVPGASGGSDKSASREQQRAGGGVRQALQSSSSSTSRQAAAAESAPSRALGALAADHTGAAPSGSSSQPKVPSRLGRCHTTGAARHHSPPPNQAPASFLAGCQGDTGTPAGPSQQQATSSPSPEAGQPAEQEAPSGLEGHAASPRAGVCRQQEEPSRRQEVPLRTPQGHSPRQHLPGQSCQECGTSATPRWRAGPQGAKTLCNACGVRWVMNRKRRAQAPQDASLPQPVAARPAASPQAVQASQHAREADGVPSRVREVLQAAPGLQESSARSSPAPATAEAGQARQPKGPHQVPRAAEPKGLRKVSAAAARANGGAQNGSARSSPAPARPAAAKKAAVAVAPGPAVPRQSSSVRQVRQPAATPVPATSSQQQPSARKRMRRPQDGAGSQQGVEGPGDAAAGNINDTLHSPSVSSMGTAERPPKQAPPAQPAAGTPLPPGPAEAAQATKPEGRSSSLVRSARTAKAEGCSPQPGGGLGQASTTLPEASAPASLSPVAAGPKRCQDMHQGPSETITITDSDGDSDTKPASQGSSHSQAARGRQAGGGVGTSRLSQQHQAPAGRAARKREPSPDSDFVIIV